MTSHSAVPPTSLSPTQSPATPASGSPGSSASPGSAPGAGERGLPAQGRPAGPGSDGVPAERPGHCLPGWTAYFAVALAAAAALCLLWQGGFVPDRLLDRLRVSVEPPRYFTGALLWAALAPPTLLAVFALGGLTRGRPGLVLVLTRYGAYRGTIRRTGLLWISPLLDRHRVDVSLRHWRSRPIEAVDADGTPLQVSVLLVWRVRETARAVFAVDDHIRFVRESVEACVARAVSRHPADDFRGQSPTLRDCERLSDFLGRLVAAELRPVGVEVFSVTPVRFEYGAEVAGAMRRARVSAVDAKRRKAVLDEVLGAVAETVRGISERGIVQLDEYERKALVRDLTVALLSHPPALSSSIAG
ncbi:MAG: hypothetical protein QOF98_718, partial [Streptomyces sp.]|nr:hypothetical protein [Streptomyces sp.]